MFDLSRDLPYRPPPRLSLSGQVAAPNGEVGPRWLGRKRRRDHEHGDKVNSVRRNGSGAGSRVPDSRLGSGISRKIQRISHDDVKHTTNYWRQRHEVESSSDDSDMDMHATNGLGDTLNGTRGQGEDLTLQSRQTRGLAGNGEGGNKQHSSSIDEGGNSGVGGRPHWWHTYKYRPIMGIVPLSAAGQRGLEVAVVERPIWEVDLPPRYYGDQEWDQPDA
jgi:U3 small nucleolar RNA-associated protein 4